MSADTDVLLATVREHITTRQVRGHEALAALDSLAAELERLTNPNIARDQLPAIYANTLAELERVKEEAGIWEKVARRESLTVERVKAERDAAMEDHEATTKRLRERRDENAVLQARLDKALSALREVADGEKVLGQSPAFLREVARAAIAEIEGEA